MDYPKIINLAPEIEKDINRGGVVWYQRADGSICEEVNEENEIRKLLKPRVKRIRIDTY